MKAINAMRDPGASPVPEARVLPLRRGPEVSILPDEDLDRIRSAIFRILEGTGIRIGSGSVRDRLAAEGAEADGKDDRVRFRHALVEDALRRCPSGMVLAARDPTCDLSVGGTDGWLATGGPADLAVDLSTDARRAPTLDDLIAATRIADAVPQIGCVGPSVTALDVPPDSRTLHQLHAQMANTTKHVRFEISTDGVGAESLLEIGRAVAEGDAALRERPVFSAFLRIRSPLALDGDALEAAAVLAMAGIPCGFVTAPIAGTNAPATLAGTLAAAGAEALAGVVALQLLAPGAPALFGSSGLRVPTSGGEPTPGGPQDLMFQMAWVQLARDLGLPVDLPAFDTGAKASDWQAGMEGGLSATGIWMTGPDLLVGAGLRDGGRLFSPIAMLLDAELFDLVRQVPLGFQVDEEALALEVIEKVGPGGHFLGEPHTLHHMREAWMARFMDKESWEGWEAAGRPEPPERAAEHALEVLDSHEPTPLPSAAEERIREVIAEHERRD